MTEALTDTLTDTLRVRPLPVMETAQNWMHAVMAISDIVAVLDRGTAVHSGPAASVRDQPELLDRLLGVAP